jgi:hypothetical protein
MEETRLRSENIFTEETRLKVEDIPMKETVGTRYQNDGRCKANVSL